MPQVRIKKETFALLEALAKKDGTTPDEKLAQVVQWRIQKSGCS